MKLLVTGALGHVGSKLIHSIKPGQFKEVILIDNLSTQRYSSLFDLPKGVNFKFYEEDICQTALDKYLGKGDVVIHLAAITDAASTFDKKELVEAVNYLGTKRVAEACIRRRSKLFFPSTTSVYGSQSEVVDENCTIDELKPQSPYAESKLKAEQLLIKLGKEKKLKFVICRLGTIFGTSIGMRFHTAVNKFAWQACMGLPISVWRTAMNQKRPYLDLQDAVKTIFHIIKKDLFNGQVYNVVTTNCTVADIVNSLKGHIPTTKIQYVESPIMNQLTYTVNNEKFRETGYVFTGSLTKAVCSTLGLFKSLRTDTRARRTK
jgi:UDP-glucose 4-epimerase